jgi:thymidylate kinase
VTTTLLAQNQRSVLEALTQAGIEYVVLRGSIGSGDLDLLVAPGQVQPVTDALALLGVRPAPSEHHWPHHLLVGYAAPAVAGERGVHVVVDVLDRLVVRGLHLGGPDLVGRILAGRVLDRDGTPRPDPAQAAWIEVLSGLLHPSGCTISPPYPALPLDSGIPKALDDARGTGTAAQVIRWLANGEAETARQQLMGVRRRRPIGDLVEGQRALWSGRLGLRADKAQSTGIRVVLLGPDGAGKSTLSRGLARNLPLPVHEIYMGVFRVNTWHRISRYLPGAGLLTRLGSLMWRSTKAQWYVRRGHVVVFDRYTFDAGLRPGSRGFRSRFSYFMIERSVEPPDLVIVLDAPGAVMFERKREHDVETLEQRRQWYADIAASLPNAVLLDSTQPPEAVLQQAVDAVWRTIRAR